MKKLNIFLMAALALGFASCEDKSDLGIAQVNPELPAISLEGFSVTLPTSVNLDATVGQQIPMVTVNGLPENLPENANISYKLQVSGNEDFSNATEFEVVDGAVSSDEWENFLMTKGSKSPAVVTNYVRVAAYMQNNGQLVRLGGENGWFGTTSVSVTPVDLRLDIEEGYYLVTSTGKIELNHSDAHVYDDPVFSYSFELADDQVPYSWQIAPASKVNGGDADFYGVSETGADDSLEGSLELGGQKGKITEAGKYVLTCNMLDLTYAFKKANAPEVEYLWTPGPANGWGFDNNMLLTNKNDGTFGGYVYIQEKFKLTAQPDWSPLNWGVNNGVMTEGGADIEMATGLYYVVADFNTMTLGATPITRIGVIGDFNGWGSDVALTPNDTFNVWTGDVNFESAGGWKFRMNDNWDLNLGGATMDDLTQGGPNLSVDEAGIYTVTLDLKQLPYSCTIVKK